MAFVFALGSHVMVLRAAAVPSMSTAQLVGGSPLASFRWRDEAWVVMPTTYLCRHYWFLLAVIAARLESRALGVPGRVHVRLGPAAAGGKGDSTALQLNCDRRLAVAEADREKAGCAARRFKIGSTLTSAGPSGMTVAEVH